MNKKKCPPWLKEQPHIAAILHIFVTKFDDKPIETWPHPPGVTLTERRYPWLFKLDQESDQQWEYLLSLVNDYGVFELKYDKKRNPLDPEFSKARLRINLSAVDTLRQWLQRPVTPSLKTQWRALVEQNFPKHGETLHNRIITYAEKSSEQVINGFVLIDKYCNHGLTLRQLSAKCFWGDSKFLEGREELLLSLYPEINVAPRPVMINIFLPKVLQAVLFIENQDSYLGTLRAQSEHVRDLALVYCAGFRGSADRIRNPQGVSLHYQSAVGSDSQRVLESWWFKQSNTPLPVYFWGDLDFAGMRILKTLKQRFSHIEAWKPGYNKMLQHQKNGNAHPLQTSDKGNQTDPESTGCDYADAVLLPAIRQTQTFVDQEVVEWMKY